MKKPLLAMFVVAAIAVGLLIVLVIGLINVDEDGREQNGGPLPGTGSLTERSVQASITSHGAR